jgi:UDP-N-acetylmuramoyl-L-alanyl-D-glutamate--2,6-diaminopimelate ligase
MESKKLKEIVPQGMLVSGYEDIQVYGLTIDSRKVTDGYVFAALKGTKVDGHDYIEKAISLGAKVILCEKLPVAKASHVCYIQEMDVAQLFAKMAFEFYNISKDLKVIGVTGTNGKTTVATLLFQLMTRFGYKCGLISTVENMIGDKVIPSTHTTPDAEGLAKLMSEMQNQECDYIFMEVSSHALDQGRVDAVPFKGALFTNITRDHLDYHGTFAKYIEAKKKFFDILPKHAFTMVNIDDKNGPKMVEGSKAKLKYYALKTIADYKAKLISTGTDGLHLMLDGRDFYSPMVGEFNAYNLMAVYGAACELGLDKDKVLTVLSMLKGAEGRMESVENQKLKIKGFVDYAHTPDALDNVIATVSKAMKPDQQLITVIGCGGDRDKGKRSMMAKSALAGSQIVILTSDNPRSENPQSIIDDMMNGVDHEEQSKVLQIIDRRQAIKTAVMFAKPGDIILVAGKGHEKTQEINGEKLPFEDKKELEAALAARS